jgi:hypothetical protein
MSTELSGALRLRWKAVGSAAKGSDGKVKFPTLSTEPGLYRFRIWKQDGSKAVYVRESDNLQRRFSHYRNPGPTQETNLRLNALFMEVISNGGNIEIDVVTDQAWIIWSDVDKQADFSRKSVRRLFENFILSAEKAIDIQDLNR